MRAGVAVAGGRHDAGADGPAVLPRGHIPLGMGIGACDVAAHRHLSPSLRQPEDRRIVRVTVHGKQHTGPDGSAAPRHAAGARRFSTASGPAGCLLPCGRPRLRQLKREVPRNGACCISLPPREPAAAIDAAWCIRTGLGPPTDRCWCCRCANPRQTQLLDALVLASCARSNTKR